MSTLCVFIVTAALAHLSSQVQASNCTDLSSASYCARNIEYCDDPNGLQGMRYYCNKSCGFCGGFPRVKQDTSCVDISGTDYCESSKEDCLNPVFKYNMKNYCNKTCGYCMDASTSPPSAGSTSTPSGPEMPPGSLPDGTSTPSSGPQPPMPPGA
ncbi:hypothetical protein AAVH_30305 [Aphelenchoides avenae]|nr:hypothetical protein AAVH_30305 [Aphelenchus avenae]